MELGFLLTFAMEETLKKVGSTAIDEITQIWGLNKDLEKLRERAWRIQSLLRQAEDKQNIDPTNYDVNTWLMMLQDVVYSADDVLDEFSYEILRRKVKIGDKPKRKICSYLTCRYNPGTFRRKIANKVKEINKTLANFEKQAISEFALKVVVGANSCGEAMKRDQMGTHSLLDESQPPVGRAKELEEMITFMEAQSSSHHLKFVCIMGFGGLGKTTLAKMVYAAAKTKKLFDVTVWIDVSKTSSADMILGDMLQKVDKSAGVSHNISTTLESLQEKLKEKTFLLVLDNVWNKEDTDWKGLENSLSLISQRKGNTIIMTTRIMELANIMETSCRHSVKLQELSDDKCWSIIKDKVFGKGEKSVVPEDLLSVGFDIAKKCKGVPLVAQVVSGTLCSARDKKDWESLRDSSVWQNVERNNILPVLRLSFDHLRSPLKQCFAYCSVFRKNTIIEKEQLIQLWMAEGFLDSTTENASASKSSQEEIGGMYFDVLVANSFFQNVEVDRWGDITRCKMHDLVHDLATSIFNQHQDDGSSTYTFKTNDCRRVSLFVNDERQSFEDLIGDELRKLRSLHSNKEIFRTLSDFKSLRCLNLYGSNCKESLDEIGALKHLRYLDISNNYFIEVLPESITKLYNLQTLRVLLCRRLKELPSNIGNLVSLRHIHFSFKKQMTFKVGPLINLRTLPLFVVGEEEGYKIQELKHLNKLKGTLKIFNLDQVRNGSEAMEANLQEKNLSKLRLTWRSYFERDHERDCNDEEVLKGLQPPRSVMRITIDGHMGKQFPKWNSSLNQLAKLKLLSCDKVETMPTLGHLPALKILQIRGMDSVRRIGSEFYGESNGNVKSFPALEELELRNMESLEEWWAPDEERTSAFPSLQDLSITFCSLLESIHISHLSSLRRMYVSYCSQLTSFPTGLISLEDLRINYCSELESISSSQDLVSLKYVKISDCSKLISLPMGLRSIEDLDLCFCKGLKSISISEDLVVLKRIKISTCTTLAFLQLGSTSLENVAISDCDELKSISSSQDLVSLKTMNIRYCYELTLLQLCSTSLEDLYIFGCTELAIISSSQALPSLNRINILNCQNITSLPQGLPLLELLKIQSCHQLTSLFPEIKSYTSLRSLCVCYCEGLISIEADIISSLPQLEKLELGAFSDELVEFPGFDEYHPSSNPSLTELSLIGKKNIKSLPYLGHLTALKKLKIWTFGISELPIWLGKLSSLEELSVLYCEDLMSLPRSMQKLSKLTQLYITGCSLLMRKFEEDRSAIWPYVSHIPLIHTGYDVIQDLRSPRNP